MRTLSGLSLVVPFALLAAGCPSDAAPEPFGDCRADDGDPYDIGGAGDTGDPVWIEADTLFVIVGHAGGCEAHDYRICWPDAAIMESDPVQVDLEVWHDANGDSCDAYLTETLAFDLTPLRDAWHDNYGAGPGTITIHLGGETVDYTFDG